MMENDLPIELVKTRSPNFDSNGLVNVMLWGAWEGLPINATKTDEKSYRLTIQTGIVHLPAEGKTSMKLESSPLGFILLDESAENLVYYVRQDEDRNPSKFRSIRQGVESAPVMWVRIDA